MTLSIERADRQMGLASDRTVYSSKRNRPLLLYGRLLDDSRPSHGLHGSWGPGASAPRRGLVLTNAVVTTNRLASVLSKPLATSQDPFPNKIERLISEHVPPNRPAINARLAPKITPMANALPRTTTVLVTRRDYEV
jgi:hypothetical protein